jgi:hypothetical protein
MNDLQMLGSSTVSGDLAVCSSSISSPRSSGSRTRDVGATFQDVLFLEFIECLAAPAITHEVAIDGDETAVDAFQMIDRAQQRRVSGTRRAEDGRDAACGRVRSITSSTFTAPKLFEMSWMRTGAPKPVFRAVWTGVSMIFRDSGRRKNA